MMGTNGIMYSGTVACSSRGVDRGLVMSAMINRHRPVSVLTVSVKSLFPGLSKLNTIGMKSRPRSSSRSRSRRAILPPENRPSRRTPFLPMVS